MIKPNMIISRLSDIFILGIFLILPQFACVTHKILQPNELRNEKLDDISISMKNGSIINLDGDRYQIKDSSGHLYITGIGTIISDSIANNEKIFCGSIFYNDIEKIRLTERSMISFLFVTGTIILVFMTIFGHPWN
jgi:predicted small secreted protein